jgi:hypothetical protein
MPMWRLFEKRLQWYGLLMRVVEVDAAHNFLVVESDADFPVRFRHLFEWE